MDILHHLVELCDSAPDSAKVCLKAAGRDKGMGTVAAAAATTTTTATATATATTTTTATTAPTATAPAPAPAPAPAAAATAAAAKTAKAPASTSHHQTQQRLHRLQLPAGRQSLESSIRSAKPSHANPTSSGYPVKARNPQPRNPN